jgi:hypothetical protein
LQLLSRFAISLFDLNPFLQNSAGRSYYCARRQALRSSFPEETLDCSSLERVNLLPLWLASAGLVPRVGTSVRLGNDDV